MGLNIGGSKGLDLLWPIRAGGEIAIRSTSQPHFNQREASAWKA
jgi:hypothetical protein